MKTIEKFLIISVVFATLFGCNESKKIYTKNDIENGFIWEKIEERFYDNNNGWKEKTMLGNHGYMFFNNGLFYHTTAAISNFEGSFLGEDYTLNKNVEYPKTRYSINIDGNIAIFSMTLGIYKSEEKYILTNMEWKHSYIRPIRKSPENEYATMIHNDSSSIATISNPNYFNEWQPVSFADVVNSFAPTLNKSIPEGTEKSTILLKDNLKKKLSKIQIENFPKMRKKAAVSLNNDLWESNIEVSVSGKGNTTITFTGGTFASNANIKAYQDLFRYTANKLRFKRVQYKWYEYDNATYYTIESLNDGDLAE
ncbi:hypothetical protein Barb6_03133 [Bacteroidales bacterium Barb6]|nr:hypothetical protein Barb6_03133 [Bacteroidales bacterium Barb6]